ncbi:MAG TPA: patatin-like phospholipase family protein [Streptosporangiaceae bacterium]|jgi:NTE family protein
MSRRALVLGAGGEAGIAWEVGLLAGLAERGTDLTAADLVIGTSAGAGVAAAINSGVSLAALYEAQLAPVDGEIAARFGPWTMAKFLWAVTPARRNPVRARIRLGRMAVRSRTEPAAARRAVVAARLGTHDWPAGNLLLTAVDADTGELVTFDSSSGVDLVDAVGASCAVPGVWPPVTIDGRRLMDGGMRSPANADLAAGYDRVVVVAPITQGLRPMPSPLDQATELARSCQAVGLVTPDAAAVAAFGRNLLDPGCRAPSARAGYAQAATVLADVAAVWG